MIINLFIIHPLCGRISASFEMDVQITTSFFAGKWRKRGKKSEYRE